MKLETRSDDPSRAQRLILTPREEADYRMLRCVNATREGHWGQAPLEREVSDALAEAAGMPRLGLHEGLVPASALAPQRRDLTAGTATAGGYLVETSVGGVIDVLRNRSVVGRLGVRSESGLKGNQTFAKQTSNVTLTWAPTEATQAAETVTLSLNQLGLSPHTVTAYIEMSYLIRKMSPEFAERMVRHEFGGAIATEYDRVVLNGSGASGEPLGLLSTPGIGTFSGTTLAYATFIGAQSSVLTANGLTAGGRLGATCRPTVAATLAARQGFSTLEPMWTGGLDSGQLSGVPALTSMTVPGSSLLLGDWSQMLVAEWGTGLLIRSNPFQTANFQAGIVGFSAELTFDTACLWPQSFTVATAVS